MRIFLFCLLILGLGVFVRRTSLMFADREACAEFVRVSRRQILQLLIILPVCVLLLKGCDVLLFPSADLLYKLAVDVDVDGVSHHGEGVYLVGFQSQGPLLIGNEPQWDTSVVGEAFPVDLGNRGTLFVTMLENRSVSRDFQGRGSSRVQSAAAGRVALERYFHFELDGRVTLAKIKAFAYSDTTVDLPPSALPLLVRFRDDADPRTIESVDPRNLEAIFGPGVEIKRVTASITHDKVTTGVWHYLKWLPTRRGDIGFGWDHSFNDAAHPDSDAFRQGYPQ